MDIVIDKKTRECSLKSKTIVKHIEYKNLKIPKVTSRNMYTYEQYKNKYDDDLDNICKDISNYINNIFIDNCSICISYNDFKKNISNAVYNTSSNTFKNKYI
jgi:hypothetical protein